MFGSEKAAAVAPPPLIAPSPRASSRPLEELLSEDASAVWRALDLRAMVLLSLLLQIALLVLGERRKHRVSLINKMILWLAYLSKDWVTIAALGKLSTPEERNLALRKLFNILEPPCLHATNCQVHKFDFEEITNLFTSVWTSLLVLHLGGPDTITAFSFEDIQHWTRQILTLVVQGFLAFCIIIWSMSPSFLLFFLIPFYFVGISKYIERIFCLKIANSWKTKQVIPFFESLRHQSQPLIENQESKKVLLGYTLFEAMRPDVISYFCLMEYPLFFQSRMRTYLAKTNVQVKSILQGLLGSDDPRSGNHLTHFDIAVVELGLIFDVLYTKALLIYTWQGCILRLLSFALSIGTLFFFIFQLSFGGLMLHKIAPDDVFLTMSLLVGNLALEICSVLSNLCSDWIILTQENCLVRKILRYVLQHFPCFSRRKKLSASMGQFDLLDYCWNSTRVGVHRFLQKHCGCDILENCHRSKHTKFVEVPSYLKPKEVYQSRLDSFFVSSDSFEPTRGESTLVELGERISDIRADLECSIKIHFDASIIVWHLATSICYHQDFENPNNAYNEAMKISKYLSDYMMYLLVMRPAMLLPDDCPHFSLDHALDELTDLISDASNKDTALDLLLRDMSAETAMDNLRKYAGYLATKLNQNINKWELIKAMWIEMLLYAAHSYPHINHVRQRGKYGREFISIIWIMGSYRVIQEVIEEDCIKAA